MLDHSPLPSSTLHTSKVYTCMCICASCFVGFCQMKRQHKDICTVIAGVHEWRKSGLLHYIPAYMCCGFLSPAMPIMYVLPSLYVEAEARDKAGEETSKEGE